MPAGGRFVLAANAGPDQSGMFVGTTVNLDGSGSIGATTYKWTFTAKPTGSQAVMQNPTTVTPSFVPDKVGSYAVKLTVGNGTQKDSDTVVITTANRPPVADAGPDLNAAVGDAVILNGLRSSDPDGSKLTYAWTIVNAPPTSAASLGNAATSKASLFLDRPGTYVIQLIVKDAQLFSPPDQAIITTTNTAPVANAGPDRRVAVSEVVQLNGTGSSDVDEDALTYSWNLKRPNGSAAQAR